MTHITYYIISALFITVLRYYLVIETKQRNIKMSNKAIRPTAKAADPLSAEQKAIMNEGGMRPDDLGVFACNAKEQIITGHFNSSKKSLKEAEQDYSDAAGKVSGALEVLADNIKLVKLTSTEARRAAKSAMTEIKDQLIKVDNVVGNVEVKVIQLERIAKAMQTISDLSKDAGVMNTLSAMSSKR